MTNKIFKKGTFVSTIIIFLIGFLSHFSYGFTKNNFIVGLITPVNESIFEHLKLAFFPILIWWILFYFFKKEKYSLNKSKWFLGCLVSLTLSIIIIPSIYYFTRYGIGKELIIVDIMSLYIAILTGQFAGYYIYKHTIKINFLFSIITICILSISFIVLTITPLKLPLFKDNEKHTYGINKTEK